jgi:hypothetical protein
MYQSPLYSICFERSHVNVLGDRLSRPDARAIHYASFHLIAHAARPARRHRDRASTCSSSSRRRQTSYAQAAASLRPSLLRSVLCHYRALARTLSQLLGVEYACAFAHAAPTVRAAPPFWCCVMPMITIGHESSTLCTDDEQVD